MTIRTLLIDDEQPALTRLQRLLQEIEGVEVIGQVSESGNAVAEIERLRPDLLLIDVDMPGLNGFQVLEGCRFKPLTVFVSAHERFRAMALDSPALGLLSKPVDLEQVRQMVERIRSMVELASRIGAQQEGC